MANANVHAALRPCLFTYYLRAIRSRPRRTRSKGSGTTLCSDLLEVAILLYSPLRAALGDQRAMDLHQAAHHQLLELWSNEYYVVGPHSHTQLVDWMRENWTDEMENDEVWPLLEQLPRFSLAEWRDEVNATCRALTAPPATGPVGGWIPASGSAAAGGAAGPAAAGAAAAVADGEEEADADVEEGDATELEDDGTAAMELEDDGTGTTEHPDAYHGEVVRPVVSRTYSAAERATIASLCADIMAQEAPGTALPAGTAHNAISHLFMPSDRTDHKILAYAQKTDEKADGCDTRRLQAPSCVPPPAPSDGEPVAAPVDFDYGAFCRRNRSAVTLFLFWIRL